MKKIIAVLFSVLFLNSIAHAGVGISLLAGQVSTSGTENEKSGDKGPEKNSKDFDEAFYGASIYAEFEASNGIVYGIDYVPLEIELGSGQRTDTAAVSENDSGTRKASANLEDLITLYTNIPFGDGGTYGLLGIHMAEMTSSETLPNSTYGDETVYGAQFGLGYKSGSLKYELSYSDFEDISLSSSSGSSTVTGEADAISLKIAYGF